MNNAFTDYLEKHTEAEWLAALETLLPAIHEVDRAAVQVWFRFYPLSLHQFLAAAEDKDKAIQGFAMQGEYSLDTQIDSSHHFLYGHRFWKTVKAGVEAEIVTFENSGIGLAEEIGQIAAMVAEKLKVDASLTLAITAVGLMTLVQTGPEAFNAANGEVENPKGLLAKSPDAIVAKRGDDDSQGMLGFLKTINKKFSIIYDESQSDARFPIMNEQELTGASALDQSKNWKEMDERCWEGVIPVECTAASCGTCWVGVIGGQEKLTEVSPRERTAMKSFGYNQPEDEKPFMRLACQAKAAGNATTVVPPWNGVFGKKVYGNIEEKELYPATTSAKKLRETIATATVPEN
ncbi:MAG: 2Fe-2S iron-sulfur cluster binding domain-containing protein [Saprospiraceae bacterium]|nr:2Fe-2S iron-sulfur cluster binding domain-containing protein [Pyrinomonadaceae bacterium]